MCQLAVRPLRLRSVCWTLPACLADPHCSSNSAVDSEDCPSGVAFRLVRSSEMETHVVLSKKASCASVQNRTYNPFEETRKQFSSTFHGLKVLLADQINELG